MARDFGWLHVDEMLEELTADEFDEWLRWYSDEAERPDDLRTARLCQIQLGGKISDYMPRRSTNAKPEQQTDEERGKALTGG